MRGCLKHHSPHDTTTIATPPPTRSPTPPVIPPDAPSLAARRRPPPSLSDECLSRRCVHFCSELVDKIYVADEWDRSPAEVTPRLTDRDMLELKEIQRSLPHAPQPLHDPELPELDARGVPRTHFLNTVPVGLVPLIGPTTSPTPHPELVTTPPSPKLESPLSRSPPSRPPPSPPSTPPPQFLATSPPPFSNRPKPPKPRSPPACVIEPWVPPPPPPRLPYNIPIQPRPVPRFNFLPLLEKPASPTVSALSVLDPGPQRCLHSQDLPNTAPARTSSPRDEKIVSQSRDSPRPTAPPSIGGSPATSQNRPSNYLSSHLLPPSPLPSSPPSPGDTKDSSFEDTTHLEAELTRLWHSQSCSMDGETEAEESEAESSVVHTEADSDGESTHRLDACGGARKVVRTQVAVTTAADAEDDEEGEMSLVELESGVMAFVRTPRRR